MSDSFIQLLLSYVNGGIQNEGQLISNLSQQFTAGQLHEVVNITFSYRLDQYNLLSFMIEEQKYEVAKWMIGNIPTLDLENCRALEVAMDNNDYDALMILSKPSKTNIFVDTTNNDTSEEQMLFYITNMICNHDIKDVEKEKTNAKEELVKPSHSKLIGLFAEYRADPRQCKRNLQEIQNLPRKNAAAAVFLLNLLIIDEFYSL